MSISRSASSCAIFPLPGVVSTLSSEEDDAEIVGNSAAMRRLRVQVRRIGPHFRTVLVRGEAGTGKELVARALHTMRCRADEPFVLYHAMEVENALTDSGSGAETGAEDTVGRLMKMPQQGTLFLDGISKMNMEAQERLLRVLGRHDPETPQKIELRIIASTSEDLKILVSTGRFRQELYQRLATVEICLPPLRERKEDLPALARYFLDQFATRNGRRVHEIADGAMERMQRYRWPGNVRELETVLRHGVMQTEGEVLESHHLPELESESTTSTVKSVRLENVVHHHVLRVLNDCGGNKLRAAELLGISRSTLYRMLESSSQAGALR